MGVIEKNERNVPIKASISEETLYIPTSEDDRSESSVAIRHAQSRILPRRSRIPTVSGPGTAISPRCGKRKSRRYQNVSSLVTLAEEDELREVTIEDFVELRSSFGRLLQDEDSLQKWYDFISSKEETQQELIRQENKRPKEASQTPKPPCSSLKGLLRRKNLPLGTVQYLESELVQFFSNMPRDVYVSPELSGFERLLLHTLSDYHSLISRSFDSEPNKDQRVRLVKVNNPREVFPEPPQLFAEYLEAVQKCC